MNIQEIDILYTILKFPIGFVNRYDQKVAYALRGKAANIYKKQNVFYSAEKSHLKCAREKDVCRRNDGFLAKRNTYSKHSTQMFSAVDKTY